MKYYIFVPLLALFSIMAALTINYVGELELSAKQQRSQAAAFPVLNEAASIPEVTPTPTSTIVPTESVKPSQAATPEVLEEYAY